MLVVGEGVGGFLIISGSVSFCEVYCGSELESRSDRT